MKRGLLYVFTGVGLLLLITALVFWIGWLQLPWQNLNTQATRNSNQYVTSKVTELMDKQTQWESLDAEITKTSDADTITGLKSQQNALLRSMKQEIQLIDQKYVPVEVTAFVAAHEESQ